MSSLSSWCWGSGCCQYSEQPDVSPPPCRSSWLVRPRWCHLQIPQRFEIHATRSSHRWQVIEERVERAALWLTEGGSRKSRVKLQMLLLMGVSGRRAGLWKWLPQLTYLHYRQTEAGPDWKGDTSSAGSWQVMMGVRATGRNSSRAAAATECFGTDTMVVAFRHVGTTAWLTD